METGLVVTGLVLALVSAIVGCGAFFMGLLFVEPPHPAWSYVIATSPGPTPLAATVLSPGTWEIWIPKGDPCTLAVKRTDGSTIGTARGAACTVRGEARSGDTWTIEATGGGAGRAVQVGKDESVFPAPLKLTALSSLVAFVLALALLFVAAWLPGAKGPPGEHRPPS